MYCDKLYTVLSALPIATELNEDKADCVHSISIYMISLSVYIYLSLSVYIYRSLSLYIYRERERGRAGISGHHFVFERFWHVRMSS